MDITVKPEVVDLMISASRLGYGRFKKLEPVRVDLKTGDLKSHRQTFSIFNQDR